MSNAEKERLELVEDPFQERLERWKAWFDAHRPVVYGGVALVVVVVVGMQQYQGHTDTRAQDASTQLFRGLQALSEGQAEDAHGIFVEVTDEYGMTPAGRDAQLYVGTALFALGETSAASSAYRAFIVERGEDGFLGRAARAGLAACSEEEGGFADAARLYEEVGREVMDSPSGARYLLNAARCLERAGDTNAARGIYEELAVDDAPLMDEATRALALLGAA